MDIIDLLKADLADNYHSENDDVIEEMIKHYSKIASHASNRKENDEELIPYIVTAVKSAYLRRGDEGSSSSNEGGLSSSYIDIEEKLRKDCLTIRVGKF